MVKINHLRGRRYIVAFALLGALAAAAVFGMTAAGARAAARNVTVRYTSTTSSLVTRVSTGNSLPSGITTPDSFVACQGDTPLLPTGPCAYHPPADTGSPFVAAHVPNIKKGIKFTPPGPTLGANFDGMGVLDQRVYTGHRYTPPDQGLCVGPASGLEGAGVPLTVPGTQTVVFEMVNNGWAIFDTTGTMLYANSNANLFTDPYSSGDVECQFDSATNTWFFTEIGFNPNTVGYLTDLAVMNPAGYSAYQVDTASAGGVPGYCFPDFPHDGQDTAAFYITVNEFCGSSEAYAGANIYGISKPQLVAHSATPGAVGFATGVFNFTWRAAEGPAKTEYLLASDQNSPSGTAADLQVGWVTGDSHLTTGGGPIVFSMTTIPTKAPYAEPVPAQSTGDDSTCVYNFGSWCSVPEKTLDPIDMRLEQVQLSHGLLYTDLLSSTTVGQDPTVVNGATWFVVNPVSLKVMKQGTVAAAGTWLLDPSFVQSKWDVKGKKNHFVLSFSMTSPTLNPSTGYATSINNGNTWSGIATTGAGIGPHVSFATMEPGYMRRRWGDYSRIAIDPATGDVWSADEYIPNTASGADPKENWGTRIWQLTP